MQCAGPYSCEFSYPLLAMRFEGLADAVFWCIIYEYLHNVSCVRI